MWLMQLCHDAIKQPKKCMVWDKGCFDRISVFYVHLNLKSHQITKTTFVESNNSTQSIYK